MSFSHKPSVRKKPKAPPKKFTPSYSARTDFDLHDEDSLGHEMSAEEIRRHEDQQNRRAFSFLSADAVRWIQKHKPAASSGTKNFIPPSRVLQLRAIFRGLDFDGSGEIDLKELKDAVKYVASQDSGTAPPIFENPDQLVQIFEDMDIDKNGNVDFDEFLIGMTSEVASKQAGGVSGVRMQNAFFDFANQHRRSTIADKISNDSLGSQERYNELRKLYNMKYLKDEPKDCTVDEMISKMKADAIQQKAEMNKAAAKYRKAEIHRARAAHIYFLEEQPGKGHPEYGEQASKNASNSQSAVSAALGNLTGEPEEDMKILSKAGRTVRRNMCKFSFPPADTYTPSLLTRQPSNEIERKIHDLAYTVKNAPVFANDLMRRPENTSQSVLSRVETQRMLHFTTKEVEVTEKKKPTSGLALANVRRAERGASMYGSKSSSIISKVSVSRKSVLNMQSSGSVSRLSQ